MTGHSRGPTSLEVRSDLPEVGSLDAAVWQADLDGHLCRTARGFLVEVGVALGFPAYYGRNWDAFYECFGDLLEITDGGMGYEFYDRPGRPERVLHLLVRHADELLADAEPRDLGVLVWKLHNPYPRYRPPQLWHRYADLRVTFVCTPETVTAFTERLRVADQFRHDGVA
jgi:hypothetical protein